MEPQSQPPAIPKQEPVQSARQSTGQAASSPGLPGRPQDGDKKEIPVEAAQALLTISGSGTSQKRRGGMSLGLIISLVTVIVLVVAASYTLSSYKPSKGSSGNNTIQSDTNAAKGASNEINQDVNTCSNPAKAAAEC